MDPLYIHVIINHLPEMGLGLALLAVFLGLVLRSHQARRVGLILVFICAASALPVLKTGQKGYNEIYFSLEQTDRAWLDAHMRTAEEWIWVFYLLAALALVAIICPLKWPRTELALVLIVLAFGAGTFALSGYIAYLGGRVRHVEFREGPPPIAKHN
jgi:disulfide bond formation protein DsbB